MSNKSRAVWHVLCLSSLNTTTLRGRNYYYFYFTVVETKADAWNSYQESLIPASMPLSVILYIYIYTSRLLHWIQIKLSKAWCTNTLNDSFCVKKILLLSIQSFSGPNPNLSFKNFPSYFNNWIERSFLNIQQTSHALHLRVHSSLRNAPPTHLFQSKPTH